MHNPPFGKGIVARWGRRGAEQSPGNCLGKLSNFHTENIPQRLLLCSDPCLDNPMLAFSTESRNKAPPILSPMRALLHGQHAIWPGTRLVRWRCLAIRTDSHSHGNLTRPWWKKKRGCVFKEGNSKSDPKSSDLFCFTEGMLTHLKHLLLQHWSRPWDAADPQRQGEFPFCSNLCRIRCFSCSSDPCIFDVEDTPPEVEEETPDGLVTLMEESLQLESRGELVKEEWPRSSEEQALLKKCNTQIQMTFYAQHQQGPPNQEGDRNPDPRVNIREKNTDCVRQTSQMDKDAGSTPVQKEKTPINNANAHEVAKCLFTEKTAENLPVPKMKFRR
ncbi:hypothetical protein GH733_010304 [Mirounga leonina]|nr:hypothetical protein GH733_010304 [Mirounga leonina]